MEQQEILKKLQEVFPRLPNVQKKVAKYVSEHLYSLGIMSAKDLAAASGVSESTVFRFAQSLGFDGYLEMRHHYQKNLRELTLSSDKLRVTISGIANGDNFLHELIQGHKDALDALELSISPESLKEAAQMLLEAETLYLYGEGSAQAPAMLLSFWLRRLSKPVVSISAAGRECFEKIMHISSKDVALGFGFRKINRELEILFKETKLRGGGTVLVTDQSLAGIMEHADVVLAAKRGKIGEFRSMAIPVILADALLVAVAKLDPERLEHLRRLEELRAKYGYP